MVAVLHQSKADILAQGVLHGGNKSAHVRGWLALQLKEAGTQPIPYGEKASRPKTFANFVNT